MTLYYLVYFHKRKISTTSLSTNQFKSDRINKFRSHRQKLKRIHLIKLSFKRKFFEFEINPSFPAVIGKKLTLYCIRLRFNGLDSI